MEGGGGATFLHLFDDYDGVADLGAIDVLELGRYDLLSRAQVSEVPADSLCQNAGDITAIRY